MGYLFNRIYWHWSIFTFKQTFDLFANENRRRGTQSLKKKSVYIIISIFSLWKNKRRQKNKETVLRISGILVWMNPSGYHQNLQDPLWFSQYLINPHFVFITSPQIHQETLKLVAGNFLLFKVNKLRLCSRIIQILF